MTRWGMTLWTLAIAIVFMAIPAAVPAKEKVQEWELINPAGTIAIQPIKPAPRLSTLEGKTIVLRWNGKHNGDSYLNRIAERLAEKVPSAKVIKIYEVDKSTVKFSSSNQEAARIAKVIKDLKADIVIGAQAD
jgi:hypothetical protein